MVYNLEQAESDKIIEHFGEMFYRKALRTVEVYAEKWNLEIFHLVDYYSVNCIFICESKYFGDAVLKIGNPTREVFTEVNLLKEYGGRRFCKVFDCDIENGVILEECITPGTRLREEKSLDKRLLAFSQLFNGLHIPSSKAESYPTYLDWVCRITEYMSNENDHKDLYKLMKKAKDLCLCLCNNYSQKMLLHGDFHHDNILLGKNNEYKIIDPKGVIGDPIFDIPRFVLNEFYDNDGMSYEFYKKHVDEIMKYLNRSIDVPIDVMKKCVFIETAMANCWNVESNEKPNLDSVMCAEAIMSD